MKQIYLIGNPLGHSYSPQIHAEFGRYDYCLHELNADDLEHFIRHGEWDGLNVTIPYKQAVVPFLDRLTPEAERIGAVNTIVRENGKLVGHNTDYAGFRALVKRSGIEVTGKKAVILGSGGSSHTVRIVLADMGAREIVVVSRTGENNYENLSLHRDAEILVNTTPVGMYPNNGVSPLDLSLFDSLDVVFDLIYNPSKTELILSAEEKHIPCESGLLMLVSQARAAAELFSGESLDEREIDRIVRKINQKKRNLILVGMPGAGKSSVGFCLASLLNRRFVDTDDEITKTYGHTPEEMILTFGENTFRDAESAIISAVTKESSLVIASGGGSVIRQQNCRRMKQNATVIFLNRPLDDLSENDRPLSKEKGIEQLWNERKSFYEKVADVTIPAEETPEMTARKIKEVLDL